MFVALEEKDLEKVLSWRNHPEINKWMLSQDPISFEQHSNWFKNHQGSETKKLYVWIYQGEPNGFLQFDLSGDLAQPSLTWGFYKSPTAPKGAGKIMLREALELAFHELHAIEIIGEILHYNTPSISLHERLGFLENKQLSQQVTVKGTSHELHHYSLPKSNWTQEPKI